MQDLHKFRGTVEQKIDAKGRLSIPSQFRRILEQGDPDFIAPERDDRSSGNFATFVLVFGNPLMRHFECYSHQGMKLIDARIEAMDFTSDERALAEQTFYGDATTLTIDFDGRIVLPQDLRTKLKLSGETLFVGKGDHFEIWNPATRSDGDTLDLARRIAGDRGFRPRAIFQGPPGGA